MTLRYPYDVCKEDEYFTDIENEKIPKDMMSSHHTSSRPSPATASRKNFGDHYEDALKELLKKKQSGEKIEAPGQREPAKVISLMDALRRSVDAERVWRWGWEKRAACSSASDAEESRTVQRAQESRLAVD